MKYNPALFSLIVLLIISCKKEPEACFTESVSNLTVSFNAECSSDEDEYLWDFGDNKSSEIKTPIHTYSYETNYTVTLQVKNKKGLKTVSKKLILKEVCGVCECKYIDNTTELYTSIAEEHCTTDPSTVDEFKEAQKKRCDSLNGELRCDDWDI